MTKYLFTLCVFFYPLLISCSNSERLSQPSVSNDSIIVFDDFENGKYDHWTIEGNAFGKEPHTGTSPRQNRVSGFLGKRLVNSYLPDDVPQGRLISKKFTIQKSYISFLIGGGNHPDETCLNLVIEGTREYSQTGEDNERLTLQTWDIGRFLGKEAYFEIIDRQSGPWGHINIDHIFFSDTAPSKDDFLEYKPMLKIGKFIKIYDPSIGEKEKWYINDHSFIYGNDGLWHMFGITHAEPANPSDEDNFAHTVSSSLTFYPWTKLPYALSIETVQFKETHLWAPHVIEHNHSYYMYYCAGESEPGSHLYKIHLAFSKDLKNWKRHPVNPLFIDGCHARDPNIIKVGERFVMYYTATDPIPEGNHVVAYRTSKDLIHWDEKKICFRDMTVGCCCGATESPFVVRRGEYYYLFIGPRGGYVGTDVFRSKNPFQWDLSQQVGQIQSHALEVIRDLDGKWYVSSCGWGQGGVYIAPLTWLDGLDDSDCSLKTPKVSENKKPRK